MSGVTDGDRNTASYFHHKASQRKRRNRIDGLFDDAAMWQQDDEKFEEVNESYYAKVFTSDCPSPLQLQEVLKHVPCSVTHVFNASLMKLYSKEEIHTPLLQMHLCKARWPDGMHAIFYQRSWHIVRNDVTDYVSNIFTWFIIFKSC